MLGKHPAGHKNRRVCSLKACVCKHCGAEFSAVKKAASLCSNLCKSRYYQARRNYGRTCVECGKEFKSPFSRAACCSKACVSARCSKAAFAQGSPTNKIWSSRADAYRYYSYKRRMIIGASDAEIIDSVAVFERDGWLCQICDEEIDRSRIYPDPGAATLDHRIPVSLGGRHTYENVQCAHFGCNSRKSNKLRCEAA